MCKALEKSQIPCTVVLDSAVGYIMESVDMVMVGAEGVVESGGIINKVCLKCVIELLRTVKFVRWEVTRWQFVLEKHQNRFTF